MTLSASTLSTQLQGISGATEAAARASWSAAWATYFADAVAGSGPGTTFTTNPTPIAAARAAMETALVGMSTSGQGASKIQAGIVAWWDYLVANPGDFFASATSITKPSGLTDIASDFAPILADNRDNSRSAAVACGAVATMIHDNNAGGSADISGTQTIT